MDDFSNTNEVIKLVTFDETTKELSLQDLGGTYTLDLNILSQNLSFSNDTLFISDKNEIFLGDYHKDSSTTNELITNTNFNTTSKDLSITDAGQTFNNDLSILSQTLDLTSDVLSISDQNDVNLSIYHKDSSASNEIQGLSTSNDTIFMDRGGFAKLTETDFWNTDGNVGTSPLSNFIGTRDNTDFVLRTNNVENMRIKSTGDIGIGTDIPDEKLDVFGNIELSGGNRTVQTQVMTANGTGFSLTLKASDNKNNGFNAQNGGNVIVQGGKGFNWSTGAGGGHVVIRSGANETQANAGFRDGGYIVFQTGAKNNTFIERARMLDNGNFGIGTTTPGYKLQVGNSGDGSSARANSWNTFSDRRWKTKIELISNALEKLDQISGYTYKWKVGTDTTTQVGVIAQEIELVLPEAVKTDAEGYKSVDYGKLSALLIEAVKEQQITISLLENQIQQQKMRTDSIESRLNKLEKL